MAIASRSFLSTRVLLVLAVLALLGALVAVLIATQLGAGPHLHSAVQGLFHSASTANPLACGAVPGTCDAPIG